MGSRVWGCAWGGIALLAVSCGGKNILLTTASAGAPSGDDHERDILGGSGGGAEQATPQSGGSAGDDGKGGLTFGGSGGEPIINNAAGAPDSDDLAPLGPWQVTANYPTCPASDPARCSQACVASSGHVYCLGAESESTFVSRVSSAGIGPWTATSNYPVVVRSPTCVTDGNVIYCVGGWVQREDGLGQIMTASVFFAPLSEAGIGAWTATTALPTPGLPKCAVNAGYIYCVTDQAYYAPLSASGIGTWQQTLPPPTLTAGCVSEGDTIYCFGGGSCPPSDPNGDCYSPSYYASLTNTGISAWKSTTPLPTAGWAKYVSAGSYLYYMSTPVFGARLSADGIGPWQTATNYPHDLNAYTCFSSADYIYCADPESSASYFAQVGVDNPFALHLVNPPSAPRSRYLGPAWIHDGGGSVTVDGVMAGTPMFRANIDEAVVFDCAADAATPAGCQTTVISPEDTSYNYDMTIWYPCPTSGAATTNCCFQAKLDQSTPSRAWCASTDTGSFIITQPMSLR
ncbi:MAG TPA: hypothetical protein VER96_08540 [Polyangiaceae bacterium]|nr:hypothetical protein [Polyangiaceae bacterium]